MKVAIIGRGAIGTFLLEKLANAPAISISGVMARMAMTMDTARDTARDTHSAIPQTSSIADLLSAKPDIVVECAGHEALRTYGTAILKSGADLLVASVGALADAELEAELKAGGTGRLIIPGGALGGLDALSTAREAGLDSVEYIGRKSPQAWKGTAAEREIDLASVSEAQTFLECDARTAALRFPQNANVVAALALAGIGFDRTRARLVVDPEATGNQHTFVARGAFGQISCVIQSTTLPSNPKTSVLAPYSLLRTLKLRAGLIDV